jgi:hypothetical protein
MGVSVIQKDRFGIGWRPQLAAGIFANLDKIDIVEVIADHYFACSSRKISALRTLAAQTPLTLHGVGLGPASTVPVETKRIDQFARLIGMIQPESWSEHLAWVRGGGIDVGHLASPPRNSASVNGTLENLHAAAKIVGTAPLVENIASLIDPPLSTLSEAQWLSQVMQHSAGGLLLDLHNVHTNATNFGFDPYGFLDSIPLQQIGSIHIAGGMPIEDRILDDHLHDVPDPVYDLLRYVAARTDKPLTVILERDGKYPPMASLLAQLEQAREAVRLGREEKMAAV